jgi:CopG family transcriptional regulator, nickel-responsive regulator
MPIISVSIDEKTLSEADDAVERLGFGNRSDLFRKGVKTIVAEVHQSAKLPKEANAVLIVMHEEEYEGEITKLKHRFEDVVTMQTHTKLDAHHCLEVFVLKGSGERISKFSLEVNSNKRMRYSKLFVP